MLVHPRHVVLVLGLTLLPACSTGTATIAPTAILSSADPASPVSSGHDRVMVYDAELVIEAIEPDSLVARATRLANSLGGYVLEAGVREITLRVPSENLELRLSSALRSRERYLELLERAANVSEALQVEKELERIDREIERLEGELNALRERVRFSTLTVRHQEKLRPGPVGWVFTRIGEGVKWLFVRD